MTAVVAAAQAGNPAPAAELAAAQAYVRAVVERSGTSFALGMRILPRPRREAMYAVYAFCREVDDIADEPGDPAAKRLALAEWRAEIERLYAGHPSRPTSLALAGPVRRYALPRAEFLAMIDGMAMDAEADIRAPDTATLTLYCRRVAGSVGLLSIRIFGADEPAAPDFAVALAEALQLTNILRDLDEDAARGRLYLPAELLARHGVPPDAAPEAVLSHPGVAAVCAELAGQARGCFAAADAALARCRRWRLRPALLMMGTYEYTLDMLERRGWAPGAPALHLSKRAKLWAGIRQGLLRRR